MTAQARITQADYDRASKVATKAFEKSGKPTRVIFRLEQREIEIIVGDDGPTSSPGANEWADDDV